MTEKRDYSFWEFQEVEHERDEVSASLTALREVLGKIEFHSIQGKLCWHVTQAEKKGDVADYQWFREQIHLIDELRALLPGEAVEGETAAPIPTVDGPPHTGTERIDYHLKHYAEQALKNQWMNAAWSATELERWALSKFSAFLKDNDPETVTEWWNNQQVATARTYEQGVKEGEVRAARYLEERSRCFKESMKRKEYKDRIEKFEAISTDLRTSASHIRSGHHLPTAEPSKDGDTKPKEKEPPFVGRTSSWDIGECAFCEQKTSWISKVGSFDGYCCTSCNRRGLDIKDGDHVTDPGKKVREGEGQ